MKDQFNSVNKVPDVFIKLIGNTKTKSGLKIKVVFDKNIYKTARNIADKEFKNVNIEESDFHDEWTYKIKPKV